MTELTMNQIEEIHGGYPRIDIHEDIVIIHTHESDSYVLTREEFDRYAAEQQN